MCLPWELGRSCVVVVVCSFRGESFVLFNCSYQGTNTVLSLLFVLIEVRALSFSIALTEVRTLFVAVSSPAMLLCESSLSPKYKYRDTVNFSARCDVRKLVQGLVRYRKLKNNFCGKVCRVVNLKMSNLCGLCLWLRSPKLVEEIQPKFYRPSKERTITYMVLGRRKILLSLK